MSQYQIYIDNGDGQQAFYLPGVEELALADIHYKPSAGSAGTLSFTVPPTHPLRDQVHPLSTDFWLVKGGKRIFRGRYIGREDDFYKTGKIDCEGDLNFLVDSIQDPYDYTGGIAGFFDRMLTAHNGMVEARKQFKRGIVNVADENNYINRSNSNYSTTAEALKAKLVETHGGFLRVRHETDGNYLDYVYDYGGTNAQVIRFGQNLLDITKSVDATQIVTALIPIGAEVEYTDELGETQTRRVDITSVNDGKKYVVNQAAVDRWGMIWGTHEWEDVTLPTNLKAKAEAYLEECAALPETMELTALDLSLIDVSVDELQVGYWTQVVSGPHGVSGLYMLYEADINISDPDKSKISLGGRVSTLSGTTAKNQIEASRAVQQTAEAASEEINRKIENATTLITGGFGGYVVFGQHRSIHREENPPVEDPYHERADKGDGPERDPDQSKRDRILDVGDQRPLPECLDHRRQPGGGFYHGGDDVGRPDPRRDAGSGRYRPGQGWDHPGPVCGGDTAGPIRQGRRQHLPWPGGQLCGRRRLPVYHDGWIL